MALHVGLRWPEPFAGILGYSGAIPGPEHLKGDLRSKPPVLLCHGTADQVIPIDALVETVDALARADVACGWHVAHGLGHGIDGGGLQIGADMLGRVLA
jgi:phospholipase/carboxylesterase